MNTVDYVKETQRQLSNQQQYKTLDKDPTIQYNRYVHHLIDQAWRLGIILRKIYKLRIQKLLCFTFYLKYISPTTQADL